jgi:hypothetical protein
VLDVFKLVDDFLNLPTRELEEELYDNGYQIIKGNLIKKGKSGIWLTAHIDTYNDCLFGEFKEIYPLKIVIENNFILQAQFYHLIQQENKTIEEVYLNPFELLSLKDRLRKRKITYKDDLDDIELVEEHFLHIIGEKRKIESLEELNLKTVLGADDRLGVFLCDLIYNKTNGEFGIILSNNEESSYNSIEYLDDDFWSDNKIKMLISLDKRDSYYSTNKFFNNNELEEFLQSNGFKKLNEDDRSSNIDYVNIPAINIGIGFYNEHTPFEIINLEKTEKTLELLFKLLSTFSQ